MGVDYQQQQKHPQQQLVDHVSQTTNKDAVVKPVASINVTTYVEEVEDGTYEPTSTKRAYRVQSIKTNYIKESNYWKTHYPDPIPKLPNNDEHDIDPITGLQLPPIIAYATTLTSCNKRYFNSGGIEGAAILLHSIRRNSHGWIPMITNNNNNDTTTNYYPKYGGKGGRYRYRAYVFVDPSASPNNPDSNGDCARYLQKIGWIILHRASLVPLFDLEEEESVSNEQYNDNRNYYKEWQKLGSVGSQRPKDGPMARLPGEHIDKLRIKMADDGCCGCKELLKLHIYGLVQHELAVHLDFDSLLLHPMDDLFDVMLGVQNIDDVQLPLAHLPQTRTVNNKHRIDAAFTRDYNSVIEPSIHAHVGYQGGFLVVKPDLKVLEQYQSILRHGEFLLTTKVEQRKHDR
jgi:hypothetical protein